VKFMWTRLSSSPRRELLTAGALRRIPPPDDDRSMIPFAQAVSRGLDRASERSGRGPIRQESGGAVLCAPSHFSHGTFRNSPHSRRIGSVRDSIGSPRTGLLLDPGNSMRSIPSRYDAAPDFARYLESVEENRDLWHAVTRRVSLDSEAVDAARAIPGRRHLLVLSEDWCGDAVNIVPVVAALARAVPEWDLKVLERDENPDLMDAHLTNGTSRSIPIVIVYDEDFEEIGWWGPRPERLQRWVMQEGLQMDSEDRYREIRRFYAQDRGRSIVNEIVELVAGATALC